ncbi:hypothetical protein HNQ93_001633 [Hymenobacter luteus]|uniref:DUF4164 family protein n=2 Tax=Hymenobacter TaxID=89966 RepID=A0A7W9SZI1_9BACT|nr:MULTISPECIES: hypothetical protein [Hymenobacter]MBB4601006.1 hypothetical protein [Hymenobacter latericoloratus]MBB6058787.1 hypothetical protein [Hymenobacter luteus]
MATTPSPEHMRAPAHLTADDLRQALTELDAKIQTLRNRAHATAANSENTYHQHADALEAKRARLVERLGPNSPTPATTDKSGPDQNHDRSAWDEIWHGIENLRQDLRNII